MRARVVPMRACRLVRSRSITSSGGGAAIGQFLQAGQARLGHAQPGEGLFVQRAGASEAEPGEAGQRFQGEALHDQRDHDCGGGQHQHQVPLRQRGTARSSGWKQALQAFTIYFDGRIPTP